MLKGEKIYLRLLEQKDINQLYIIANEENVIRYNIRPHTMQISNNKEKLRKALSILNENNVLVGFITYKELEHYKDTYSIGITISSRYWGRKYGEDAIKTLLKYLFLDLKAIKVELEVLRNNYRAIRCYKKCGFIEEIIKKNSIYLDGKYIDTLIMGILKENIIYI